MQSLLDLKVMGDDPPIGVLYVMHRSTQRRKYISKCYTAILYWFFEVLYCNILLIDCMETFAAVVLCCVYADCQLAVRKTGRKMAVETVLRICHGRVKYSFTAMNLWAHMARRHHSGVQVLTADLKCSFHIAQVVLKCSSVNI